MSFAKQNPLGNEGLDEANLKILGGCETCSCCKGDFCSVSRHGKGLTLP